MQFWSKSKNKDKKEKEKEKDPKEPKDSKKKGSKMTIFEEIVGNDIKIDIGSIWKLNVTELCEIVHRYDKYS